MTMIARRLCGHLTRGSLLSRRLLVAGQVRTVTREKVGAEE
jgi:hypothetical protein